MKTLSLLDASQLHSGQWTTLRTSYLLTNKFINVYKSNIQLNPDNLCNQLDISLQDYIYVNKEDLGSNITSISYATNKTNNALHNQEQKLYKWLGFVNKSNHIVYVYCINQLTIYEKCVFINPNLRIHINTIYKHNKCVCVSFSSDIKKA
uniref:Uncharacterized protein n=1 Tax=Trichogloeopsis pedicellata TaxID=1495610 RepID=A0A1G4P0F5_9FLOR|nr:Hypothetical protein ycf58 [Trichogloeopsis pedicellata]SCW24393.1 Hypothetical protein ycf58 [Trichogloeopsis pedicellata]